MPAPWILVAGLLALVILVNKIVSYRRNQLYKFPGPFFAAISDIPYCYHMMAGDMPYWTTRLHAKYGPVVRISPNDITFNTSTSWRDIYGFRKGHSTFIKSPAYDAAAFTDHTRSIVNERDPHEHAKIRKMIAPAFSDRSLRDQTPFISDVSDRLINEFEKRAKSGEAINLGEWLTMTTFDTITDLALGENFHSVEAGKMHPWASFFINAAGAMGDGICLGRFPWLKRLVLAMPPPTMKNMITELKRHENFTINLVKKRQDNRIDRPDIVGRILEAEDPKDPFSTAYIAAQLSDCVIAGTDTTATATATANYFLMQHPEIMLKLQTEIRGAFKHYHEIDTASTAKLEYLTSVLNEAMRIMAPVPWIPSRVVPEGGDTVDGHFLPGGTFVSTGYVSAARSPDNFKNPEEFRPERWLTVDGVPSGDNLEASQPFSLGSRVCIGKQLAWIEMRLMMAKLHFKFDLEPVDRDLDWLGATRFRLLWDKPALMVRFKERDD